MILLPQPLECHSLHIGVRGQLLESVPSSHHVGSGVKQKSSDMMANTVTPRHFAAYPTPALVSCALDIIANLVKEHKISFYKCFILLIIQKF